MAYSQKNWRKGLPKYEPEEGIEMPQALVDVAKKARTPAEFIAWRVARLYDVLQKAQENEGAVPFVLTNRYQAEIRQLIAAGMLKKRRIAAAIVIVLTDAGREVLDGTA